MSEKCFQNRKKLLPDGNPLRNFIRETGGYVYQFRIDRFFENKKRLLPQKKKSAAESLVTIRRHANYSLLSARPLYDAY